MEPLVRAKLSGETLSPCTITMNQKSTNKEKKNKGTESIIGLWRPEAINSERCVGGWGVFAGDFSEALRLPQRWWWRNCLLGVERSSSAWFVQSHTGASPLFFVCVLLSTNNIYLPESRLIGTVIMTYELNLHLFSYSLTYSCLTWRWQRPTLK